MIYAPRALSGTRPHPLYHKSHNMHIMNFKVQLYSSTEEEAEVSKLHIHGESTCIIRSSVPQTQVMPGKINVIW